MNKMQENLIKSVREYIAEFWGEEGDEDHNEKVFKATYLQDHGGCVPEEVCHKDDIHEAIQDEFYAVFRPIADAVEKAAGMAFVFVTVSPSYEDVTRVILHGYYEGQQDDTLLLAVNRKAWNLWWADEEAMGKEIEGWYNEALMRANAAKPIERDLPTEKPVRPRDLHILVEGFQGVIEGIRAFVDEKEALAAFKTYTGRDYEDASAEAEDKGVGLWDVIGWKCHPTNVYVVPLEGHRPIPKDASIQARIEAAQEALFALLENFPLTDRKGMVQRWLGDLEFALGPCLNDEEV